MSFDFFQLIRQMTDADDQDDRKVLIHVALNALYAPDIYPVDLSELMGMNKKHVMVARGFLSSCPTCVLVRGLGGSPNIYGY